MTTSLLGLLFLLDALWVLRNPERRTLHDVMAGTVVVSSAE